MTLDDFIKGLKEKETHFEYAAEKVTRHFLLSYDESIDDFEPADFRPFIIAVLHAKGATTMESHVASTILFSAPSTNGASYAAIQNWKGFLKDIFDDKIYLAIGMLRNYDNGHPVFDKIPDAKLQSEFEKWRVDVLARFETL